MTWKLGKFMVCVRRRDGTHAQDSQWDDFEEARTAAFWAQDTLNNEYPKEGLLVYIQVWVEPKTLTP